MTKHTPGPWRVSIGNRLEVVGPKDSIGWPSTIVYNAGMPSDLEALANARLIAAAPELLAALQAVADWADQMQTQMHEREAAPLLREISSIEDLVRAAIAKATGDKP